MIIKGIWLFHPKLFNHRIVLDVDQESADERRRKREMARWGENYYPDTQPNNYFRLTKVAYNEYRQKYQPLEKADLVVKVS